MKMKDILSEIKGSSPEFEHLTGTDKTDAEKLLTQFMDKLQAVFRS
jgi:hypothetical protein